MTRIAIIGGTGADLFVRTGAAWHGADTRWGEPSAAAVCWEQDGTELLFLPRHGATGSIPPHRVNYRANIALLSEWGAERVIALNAVGSLDARRPPGSLVVPHQLIDYSWGRAHTYFDDVSSEPNYIDFTEPYDQNLRMEMIQAAERAEVPCAAEGTYGVTQGPRLETAAEIDRLERDGCDLVGMTSMPEAALARERELVYASLALVVNVAAGRGTVSIHADIETHLAVAMGRAQQLLVALLAGYSAA